MKSWTLFTLEVSSEDSKEMIFGVDTSGRGRQERDEYAWEIANEVTNALAALVGEVLADGRPSRQAM